MNATLFDVAPSTHAPVNGDAGDDCTFLTGPGPARHGVVIATSRPGHRWIMDTIPGGGNIWEVAWVAGGRGCPVTMTPDVISYRNQLTHRVAQHGLRLEAARPPGLFGAVVHVGDCLTGAGETWRLPVTSLIGIVLDRPSRHSYCGTCIGVPGAWAGMHTAATG